MTAHASSVLHFDAHVHIYPAFDVPTMCNTALERSRVLAGPLLLLLSESDGFEAFAALEQRADTEEPAASPHLAATLEPESLALVGAAPHPSVFWIAGRQRVSAEGLEILGLAWRASACAAPPRSGLPAAALIRALLDAGALTVLPWGVGKWLGRRAALVDSLVADTALRDHPRFFVGDIAHRCWPWPVPRAFRSGARVLAGTDLLPLPGLERDVAGFGSRVAAAFDAQRPAASLRTALERGHPASAFGRVKSPLRVLTEQLRYRRAQKAVRAAGHG